VRAMGHAAPKPIIFPEAEGPVLPEGNNTRMAKISKRIVLPQVTSLP